MYSYSVAAVVLSVGEDFYFLENDVYIAYNIVFRAPQHPQLQRLPILR